jgi:hypothetical protein
LSGKNKIKKEQVETKTQREEVRWTTNSPGSLDGHAPMRSSDSAHAPHFPFFFLIFICYTFLTSSTKFFSSVKKNAPRHTRQQKKILKFSFQ